MENNQELAQVPGPQIQVPGPTPQAHPVAIEKTATQINFETRQRQAVALSQSDIIPEAYKGKISNCLLAIEMAERMNLPALQVIQNLDIIYGKPSFSSKFLIGAVNSCGKFSPLRFEMSGQENTDEWGCRAYATDLFSGEVVHGPKITLGIARAEGWVQKKGSKWQTMPELMLHYRAGTLFSRLYAPEISLGMQTTDEIIDITSMQSKERMSGLNASIRKNDEFQSAEVLD